MSLAILIQFICNCLFVFLQNIKMLQYSMPYFLLFANLLCYVKVWVLKEKAKLLTASRPRNPEILEKLIIIIPRLMGTVSNKTFVD